MSYHHDHAGGTPRTAPWPDPVRPAPTSARLVAAALGTVVVAVTTYAAVMFGMMSPMAADPCGSASTEPVCVNQNAYARLLTVGPFVLGVAVLAAVWFRAGSRPRLVWFAPWAPLLAAILAAGNSLAGGSIL